VWASSPRLALRRRPTLLRNSRRARSHRDLAWGSSPRSRSRRASRSPSGARRDLSATAPVELTVRSRAARSGRSCREEHTTHGHRFCKEPPFPPESGLPPTPGKARSTRRRWFPGQKKGKKRTVGFLGPPRDAAGLVVWET
jgi:hypothetical protein